MEKSEAQNGGIEVYLAQREGWLKEAVSVVGRTGEAVDQVFVPPTEVRDDDAPSILDDLSDDQKSKLREVAGRFGIGGEADIPASADYEIIEGGKPWKIEAEAELASGIEIYSASPFRKIGQDEKDFLAGDERVETEYDMVRSLVANQPDFVAYEEEIVRPFGYDIQNGYEVIHEPTGQLVEIGTMYGKPVLILRVDREEYFDEVEQKQKYRNQPDSSALMQFVAKVLDAEGDQNSSVGLITSSTYASRAIDAVRAGLKSGRVFRVGMYGRQTLAAVKGEESPSPSPLNQVPGELNVIADKLAQLRHELKTQQS